MASFIRTGYRLSRHFDLPPPGLSLTRLKRCISTIPAASPSLRCRNCNPFPQTFHRPSSRAYTNKTQNPQRAAARNRSGPFSLRAAIIFLCAGAGLVVYFRVEKARMDRKRIAETTKGVGKPKIGGPFDLVDVNGEEFTDADMKGGFSIVYFGFTHCPDICPEELDKLAKIIDTVSASSTARISTSTFPNVPLQQPSVPLPTSPSSPDLGSRWLRNARTPLLPLFITCDPARDTPGILKTYLAEFHPGIVGLTGSWQQVKDVCKIYRVYFSTPEGATPDMDYLVDHSIYFYLMDPDGDFVEAIGRQHSAEGAAQIITEHMSDWKNGKKIR